MSGLLGGRHQFHARLRQRKLARPASQPIKQSLGEQAEIAHRREHPGTAGHPSHPACRRVVHGAAQRPSDVRIDARSVLVACRRSDASQHIGAPGVGGAIDGVRCTRIESECGAADPVWTTRVGRRQIAGVCHIEWFEDVASGVDVFGFAGDPLDHGAEENEPDV